MISQYAKLPDLVIPNGETESNFMLGPYLYSDAVGIMIYSPAGLAETVEFEVSYQVEIEDDPQLGRGTLVEPTEWFNLVDDAGNEIAVPAAGAARVYQLPVYAGALRLVATSAVGAERVFKVSKIFTAGDKIYC